jgi:molecular chaperone DnaK
MRVLAIDFGTSNTVATLRTPDGRMRPLLFDGAPLLPSAVYVDSTGRVLVGQDATHSARIDPGRFEPNPKRRIDDGVVFLGGAELPVPELFSHVLGTAAAEARRQLGAPPDEVRLTHPARWGERRRSLLVEGARLAGLGTPRLIPEPVAAASYFTAVLGSAVAVGRSLGIYDLGGGTFDATVVRRTPTGFEVLAEEGLPDVGGLDFDHAVVEHLARTYRQDPAWARLVGPVDAADRRNRRMLYDDVCAAKERLSRTSRADIHLPALEVDAHVTRDELEALIRPYLARTVACLARTIGTARLAAADLVGIFLVGGSSRIPLAANMIFAELGVAPTTLDQPETVVAEGALCIGAAAAGRPAPDGRLPTSPVSGQPLPGSVGTGQPPAGPPVPGQPLAGQPMAGQPVSGRAAAGQMPAGQVARNRPGVDQPVLGQGGRNRPVAGRAVPGQAVSGPPVSGQPVSGQPRSGQPLSGQALAGQPVSGQPMSGQPMSGRSASPPQRQSPPPAQPSPAGTPAAQPSPAGPPTGRAAPPPARQPPANPPLKPTRKMSTPPGAPQSPAPPGYPPAGGPDGPRRWYTEPAAIATAIVLALVVVAFVILLVLTNQST